jgi:hypothetical protein
MSDLDVNVAKAAFADVLPQVQYRTDQSRAPRPRNGRRVGALSAVAVVAIAGLFAMSATTGTQPAWSATPAHLSTSQTSSLDQQCRAAKTDVIVAPNGGTTDHNGVTGSGGVSVSSGDSGNSGLSVSGGPGAGTAGKQTMAVGDLPLILIDSRGSMALALYGDAAHTVVCTVDPQGGASVSPDGGPWPKPTGSELLTASAGVVMGTISIGADGSGTKPTGTTRLLGTVAPSVTAMRVDVPGVGTVIATIKDGYYSLFIPDALIGSSGSGATSSTWTAHLTLADGTAHDVPLQGEMVSSGNLQQQSN